MTPDPNVANDEISSKILMNRHHLELLAQLLEDLDTYLRQPTIAHTLRAETQPVDRPDSGVLIDLVGFQALRLRQILDR
jgi:hypothetical protein